MLELEIYLTTHQGLDQAEKLAPYIPHCDVFAPESAFTTAQTADNLESYWQHLITNPTTTEQDFNHLMSLMFDPQMHHPPVLEYDLAKFRYAFIERKPVFCQERWDDPLKVRGIQEKMREGFDYDSQSKIRTELPIEQRCQMQYRGLLLLEETNQARDQHIAQQLADAEAQIRKNNPRLAQKSTLTVGVQIGSAHAIERYTHHPVKIISLEQTDAGVALLRDLRKGASYEDLKDSIKEYITT